MFTVPNSRFLFSTKIDIRNLILSHNFISVKRKSKIKFTFSKKRNISDDKARVSHLVRLCNHLELSSLHFFDVVDDFIG